MPNFTPNQEQFLMYLSSATAAVSFIGSSVIVYLIMMNQRGTHLKNKIYGRLLLGLCTFDMLSSLWLALGKIPVPRYDGGFGTRGTCTAQGFFATLGYAVPYYNASLCLYYLMVIKYKKSQSWIKKKLEIYFHLVPIIVNLSTAVTGLYLQVYNLAGNRCWLASYPENCTSLPGVDCIRGTAAATCAWAFFGVETVFIFIFILASMVSIYRETRNVERRSSRWQFDRADTAVEGGGRRRERQRRKHTRAVAKQGMLYVGAFVVTYIWSFIVVFVQRATGKEAPFGLYVAFYTFFPLQGFFNFIIFLTTNNIKHNFLPNRMSMYNRESFMRSSLALRRAGSLSLPNPIRLGQGLRSWSNKEGGDRAESIKSVILELADDKPQNRESIHPNSNFVKHPCARTSTSEILVEETQRERVSLSAASALAIFLQHETCSDDFGCLNEKEDSDVDGGKTEEDAADREANNALVFREEISGKSVIIRGETLAALAFDIPPDALLEIEREYDSE